MSSHESAPRSNPVTDNTSMRTRLRDVHWRVASTLPLYLRRQYLYAAGSRRLGRFSEPATFNEKVQWRILNDRRPDIVRACDKLAMKDMARERVPGPELRIPETLWAGSDLREAPDLDRSVPWVLKPNHGSGDVVFGPPAPPDLMDRTKRWLRSKPAEMLGEWGYTKARPLLLLEERIPVPDGEAPDDYKIHVHDGVPRFIQLTTDRFRGSTLTFFDPEWQTLDIHKRGYAKVDRPRPPQLDRMLELASVLAAGWDFMRVDFYVVGDDIWFGEYSPYPGGGVADLRPKGAGFELGRYWILPRLEEVSAV